MSSVIKNWDKHPSHFLCLIKRICDTMPTASVPSNVVHNSLNSLHWSHQKKQNNFRDFYKWALPSGRGLRAQTSVIKLKHLVLHWLQPQIFTQKIRQIIYNGSRNPLCFPECRLQDQERLVLIEKLSVTRTPIRKIKPVQSPVLKNRFITSHKGQFSMDKLTQTFTKSEAS